MSRFTVTNGFFIVWTISCATFVLCQTPQSQQRFKGFSGLRRFNNSVRMVYYHEMTVAVTEFENSSKLSNCELIEVFSYKQRDDFLKTLQKDIGKPMKLSFEDFVKLMTHCEGIPENTPTGSNEAYTSSRLRGIIPLILPGTHWCGPGDDAKNYFDLGNQREVDKCCRRHDLCPVKVPSYGSRYNLYNPSMFTSSHCICDDELHRCLKNIHPQSASSSSWLYSSPSDSVGNLYFDVLRIRCIVEDGKDKKKFRDSKPYRNHRSQPSQTSQRP